MNPQEQAVAQWWRVQLPDALGGVSDQEIDRRWRAWHQASGQSVPWSFPWSGQPRGQTQGIVPVFRAYLGTGSAVN